MSRSTLRSRGITDWLLVILLIFCWLFFYEGWKHDNQIARKNAEIKKLKRSIEAIEVQFPALKTVSEEVIEKILPQLVPLKDSDEWSYRIVNFPSMPKHFKINCEIQGLDLPSALNMPHSLRLLDTYVHPGIAPFELYIEFTGTLQETAYYLSEIAQLNRQMIVTRLELAECEGSDLYSGNATLVFPKIFYPEDLVRIQDFMHSQALSDRQIALDSE